MPAIGRRHIALGQRAAVGHREDALQSFNLGNGLFWIHPFQSSSTGLLQVKQELRGFITIGAHSLRSIPYEQQRTISIV